MSSNNSDVEKLKECPFCGGEAILGKGHLGHYVVCRCIRPRNTRDEVIKAWNTRTPTESDKVAEALDMLNILLEDYVTSDNIMLPSVHCYITKIESILKGGSE